jgi:hypothetical protein
MDVREKKLDGLIETIPISGTTLKKRAKRAG